MKQLIKNLLFKEEGPNTILTGVSSGMLVNYTTRNRTQHLLGFYEREIYPFLTKAMNRADTLIDIGANDGYYGLAFAKLKGKKIILCEPGPIKSELIRNMTINGLVNDVDYFIVDKLVTEASGANSISIDELVEGNGKVFILMDVDGVEGEIMNGFHFDGHKDVQWLIETHTLDLEHSICALLEKHHYQVQIIRNAWWRKIIPEKRPLLHNRWLFASIRGPL